MEPLSKNFRTRFPSQFSGNHHGQSKGAQTVFWVSSVPIFKVERKVEWLEYMASKHTSGKFTLPSAEELDEGSLNKRVKKLFEAHRNFLSDKCEDTEKRGDFSSKSTSAKQTEAKPFSATSFDQTTEENTGTGHSAEHDGNCKTLDTASCQSELVVGRTFQETFAFLKDSDHYKEVAEKIEAACAKANE